MELKEKNHINKERNRDPSEKLDLKSRFLPLFLVGKRKGEKNNKSFGFKSCLSSRSKSTDLYVIVEGQAVIKQKDREG